MIRRLTLLTILLCSIAAFGQLASDDFSSYGTGNLDGTGNWSLSGANSPFTTNGTGKIFNAGRTTGDVWVGANAGSFTADQWSKADLLTSSASTRYSGVGDRCTVQATANYYYLVCSSANCELGKIINGTKTVIKAATAHGLTLPITLKLHVYGTTLTPLVNGVTPSGFAVNYTDSSIASGTPCIVDASAASATTTMDNWSADNANPLAADPTFSVASGTYNNDQTVTITSTSGSTIHYTLDGSTPTCSTGSTVSSGSSITVSATETVKAIGCKTGYDDSNVTSASYTLVVAALSFSPAAGGYAPPQSITISSATTGASIYYTLDGSTPTSGSTAYSGAISENSNITLTIKALGQKSGYTDAGVLSGLFTILPNSYIYHGFTGSITGSADTYTTALTNGVGFTNNNGTWNPSGYGVNAPYGFSYNGNWHVIVAEPADGQPSSVAGRLYVGAIGTNPSANISTSYTIDWTATFTQVYSPKCMTDDAGTPHCFVPATTVASPYSTGWGVYETHPVTSSGGSTACSLANPCAALQYWTAGVQLTGLIPFIYDPTVVKIGAKYVLVGTEFFTGGCGSNEGNGWCQGPIQLAQSDNLLGPYVMLTQGDWAHWVETIGFMEAPNILKLSTGWRLYFERISTTRGSTFSSQVYYTDCAKPDLSKCTTQVDWTTPTAITQDYTYRHGSVQARVPSASLMGAF